MAKTSNIMLPDGSTIAVPAWASEDTMNQVVNYMAATNKVDQKFISVLKNTGGDIDNLQESISKLVTGVKNSNTKEKKSQEDLEAAKSLRGAANTIVKASNFFGDSEKPLSGMVGAMGSLNSSLKGLDEDFLEKLMPETSKLGGFMKKYGKTVDVAADAGLAYLGWNAAKFEQFAEAQSKAIDAGAIFYNSKGAFDNLYTRTMKTGVTYSTMLDTVGQFGGTMTALGGSVSAGTDNFISMYGNLNKMTDQFGDLGLTNKELLVQYSEFAEYARLSGQLMGATADGGDKVNNAFTQLQIEAAGLANLTALGKSDAIRRQLGALTDPILTMGVSNLRSQGKEMEAKVVEDFTRQLGLVAPDHPLMQEFLDAFTLEIGETSGNIDNFSLERRIANNNPQLLAAIQKSMPELITGIDTMIKEGDLNSAKGQQFILTQLANIETSKEFMSSLQGGSVGAIILQLQASGFKISKDFDAFLKLSESDREAYFENTKKVLDVSGNSVVTMNNATTTFLTLQEKMTMPIQGTAEMFDLIGTSLRKGAGKIKDFFGIGDGFGEVYEDGDKSVNPNGPDIALNQQPIAEPSNSSYSADDFSFTNNPKQTADSLNSIAPEFRDRFATMLTNYNSQYGSEGYKIDITDGLKTLTEQNDLFNSGDSTLRAGETWSNFSAAANMSIYKDGELLDSNDNTVAYENLNNVANNVGLKTTESNSAIIPSELPTVVPSYLTAKSISGAGVPELSHAATTYSSSLRDDMVPVKSPSKNKAMGFAPRKHGGPVSSNTPYLVGDSLGLDNAELFVPDQSGSIISNKELKSIITDDSDLTGNNKSSIINRSDLDQEYDSVIRNKAQTVTMLNGLRETIKLMNADKKSKYRNDMINSV